MKKELTAAAAALALSVAFSGELESAAAAPVQTITVYASRIDDAKDDMACSVSVYGAGEIEDSGAHNLAELLKKKACVDVHAMNGNPLLTSIAMRGFGDNAFGRVKVVLDGEELNNVDMAAPNMTRIPLWFASRVEVLRGPSPVLYGDGAIGGVVNVRTDGTSYGSKTRMTARGGSHGTFGAAMLTSGGIEEDGILYSGGYDYLRSDGFRSRSGYDIHTANAGVRKNFANGGTFGVKVNYQNAYYELPGSLTFDEWKHHRRKAVNRGDWTRLWSWGIAADSKLKLAEDRWLRLDASVSRQYRHAKMEAWRTDTEYGYWSGAISPRYIDENDFLGHANKFTAGFDFRLDGYGEDALGSRTRNFSRLRTAAFAQEEFFITEEFSLVVGARAERIENRWRHYAGLRESHSSDLMADFELGVVYRPLDGLKLYAKATRFHRSAFCDELSYTQNGKFLNPETGESLDAGFEWEFLEEFKADFNAYGMLMDDEIFFDPAMAPFGYNRNSPGRTRRAGFDAGFSWKRDKAAEASLRYGYVHADFASGRYHGCDVPYVPKNRLQAEAGVWIVRDLELKGGCTFVDSQYVSGDYANAAHRLPSHTLFDAGLYYEPSWAKGWKASFTVDNIFDRNYCDYAGVGYYYPANGRSFLFTVSCEF